MDTFVDLASWACLLSGTVFALIGGIGLFRMPDVYTRSHAAGITDTLGPILILAGLMLQAGFTLITVKLLFILLFLLFTSPTASHALNHAAWASGLRPILDGKPPVEQPAATEAQD
ncbi:MAG: monovalent cation/H(+) antiporter subunit G [Rhodospirillaceae bacterium]